jgi:hypothetical protein
MTLRNYDKYCTLESKRKEITVKSITSTEKQDNIYVSTNSHFDTYVLSIFMLNSSYFSSVIVDSVHKSAENPNKLVSITTAERCAIDPLKLIYISACPRTILQGFRKHSSLNFLIAGFLRPLTLYCWIIIALNVRVLNYYMALIFLKKKVRCPFLLLYFRTKGAGDGDCRLSSQ